MMATLAEKQREWIASFARIGNAQERFAHAIKTGRRLPGLLAAEKNDSTRVEGCLARLWFVPEFREGHCFFRADSDSVIVKAVAALLCDFYSGHVPEEILRTEPLFLERAGITQHLSPNRRNGLSRLSEKIRRFACDHRESTL